MRWARSRCRTSGSSPRWASSWWSWPSPSWPAWASSAGTCAARSDASGGRSPALRQGGDDRLVGGVDQLADVVVGNLPGPVDGVPAVAADVVAGLDRARVALAPLGGLLGVPAPLGAARPPRPGG